MVSQRREQPLGEQVKHVCRYPIRQEKIMPFEDGWLVRRDMWILGASRRLLRSQALMRVARDGV